MKIEAGKFYKLRCDKKAEVYKVFDVKQVNKYAIHGAVCKSPTSWESETWTLECSYYPGDVGPYDIVSEWVEPEAQRHLFYRNGSKTVFALTEDEVRESNYKWSRFGGCDK